MMSLLTEKVFYYQFGNQYRVKEPQGRRKTYVCYKLKLLGDTLDQGYLTNKKKCHAEIYFIDKIKSLDLDRTQRYELTCYITWSPCPHCARELVAFIKDHPHLSLRIFASRLYFHWHGFYQWGLRHLWKSNIPVFVMAEREFADCWHHFVDHQGGPFQPWEKLTQYSNSIERRLQTILKSCTMVLTSKQSSEQSQNMRNLVDALRSLNLDAHRPLY